MATLLAVLDSLRNALYERGFDICVPFHPVWYNAQLDAETIDSLVRLPVENVESAYLIGNTKHLWSIFIEWCRHCDAQNGGLPEHPLDTYCREYIPAIVNAFHKNSSIHWSWDYGDKLVSVQRVAVVSGFAYHDVNTQVTVHPLYGVWKAYRAVVLCYASSDKVGDTTVEAARSYIPRPPPRQPNLLSKTEEDNAFAAMQYALSLSDLDAMWQIMQRSTVMTEDDHQLVVGKAWIAVRDTVERGKQVYRYTYNQLMYHYIKDVKYIKAAMAEQSSPTNNV